MPGKVLNSGKPDHLFDKEAFLTAITHFSGLKQALNTLDIPCCVNPRIVRGLDYYTRTAFEIVTDQLGTQGTVLAGGRYDGLVEELGGSTTPAVGFALGLERLAMLLPELEAEYPDIGVVVLGDSVRDYALNVAAKLRAAGCSVVHCGGGSAQRQFRTADREHVRFVIVTGEDEMAAGTMTLKDMRDGSQKSLLVEEMMMFARQGFE